MDKNFTLKKRTLDIAGVSVTAHGISIHAELYGQESNGILLYDKNGAAPIRIDFTEDMKFGSTYHCMLSGISPQEYTYLFHEDGNPVIDVFAKRFVGHRLFGDMHLSAGNKDALKTCAFVSEQFNWQEDKRPKTAYEESVYYGIHVRGFTKDASSKIKEAGTFAGVQKKIPYLKKLGVTGIVLQPIYEFEECMRLREARTVSDVATQKAKEEKCRLNYWGYLPGYYFAPKNAYSYGEDAVTELKTLVRQLHKNNIEVILQFYFEPSMQTVRIRDILLYWAQHYHIDGFELLGAALPLTEIALEPGLSDCKLWSSRIPYEEIAFAKQTRHPQHMPEADNMKKRTFGKEKKLLASADKGYLIAIRRFLKGDGGMLSAFLEQQRKNPDEYGQINFLAGYNDLRLADMVSYERKHNEANGEENRDGENENHSWNCGIEGETKKKSILALRIKLMKNALVMLFTAQGTPFLFMGDEYGKSSGGNNNPYCQDNETTWQKWNLKKSEKQMLAFTERMIALRKTHGIMRQKKPLKLTDYLSCGYPDLSYHGEEAWRTNMDYQMRHIGMMLCGKYCVVDGKEDECLYIAYNMHWEPHDFALPKLLKDRKWELLLQTDDENIANQFAELDKNDGKNAKNEFSSQSVTLPGRSVRIYRSVEVLQAPKRRQSKA